MAIMAKEMGVQQFYAKSRLKIYDSIVDGSSLPFHCFQTFQLWVALLL